MVEAHVALKREDGKLTFPVITLTGFVCKSLLLKVVMQESAPTGKVSLVKKPSFGTRHALLQKSGIMCVTR